MPIVSFAGPVLAGHTTTGTKLVLELTHVVAALIVVPALRHELAKWGSHVASERAEQADRCHAV